MSEIICPVCNTLVPTYHVACWHGAFGPGTHGPCNENFETVTRGLSVLYAGRWLHLNQIELRLLVELRCVEHSHAAGCYLFSSPPRGLDYDATLPTLNRLHELGFVEQAKSLFTWRITAEGENLLRHGGVPLRWSPASRSSLNLKDSAPDQPRATASGAPIPFDGIIGLQGDDGFMIGYENDPTSAYARGISYHLLHDSSHATPRYCGVICLKEKSLHLFVGGLYRVRLPVPGGCWIISLIVTSARDNKYAVESHGAPEYKPTARRSASE